MSDSIGRCEAEVESRVRATWGKRVNEHVSGWSIKEGKLKTR